MFESVFLIDTQIARVDLYYTVKLAEIKVYSCSIVNFMVWFTY